MTDKSLIQLMTLLSPVFPVGGFAYSGGLETACADGSGGGDDNESLDLKEINELALALSGSAERYEETISLGSAFTTAARPWLENTSLQMPEPCAYAVAIGGVTAQMELAIEQVLHAFLQSAVSNQLQAALRLMSLGQQAAVSLQHELEASIQTAAQNAATSDLDDLGTCATTMDIAAMNHETMSSRIFRS